MSRALEDAIMTAVAAVLLMQAPFGMVVPSDCRICLTVTANQVFPGSEVLLSLAETFLSPRWDRSGQ
jgi:hypothetical protein